MVLKVITIYNKDTDSMEEVLLEELQVFKVLYFEVQSVGANSALQQLNGVQGFHLENTRAINCFAVIACLNVITNPCW